MTKEEFMKAVKAYQEYLDTHPEELEKVHWGGVRRHRQRLRL